MVTITNGEVLSALTALNALLDKEVPIAGAMRIRRVSRALAEQVRDVQAERQRIIMRHAKLNEKGEPVAQMPESPEAGEPAWLDDAHRTQAITEVGELMALPFELSQGIELEHLGKIEISAMTALQLGAVLIDPEDASEAPATPEK